MPQEATKPQNEFFSTLLCGFVASCEPNWRLRFAKSQLRTLNQPIPSPRAGHGVRPYCDAEIKSQAPCQARGDDGF